MQIAIVLSNVSEIYPYLIILGIVLISITVTTFILVGKEIKSDEENY